MYVGAWAPASNQQQPARRGSQKMSFAGFFENENLKFSIFPSDL